jgi:hypothetical protein
MSPMNKRYLPSSISPSSSPSRLRHALHTPHPKRFRRDATDDTSPATARPGPAWCFRNPSAITHADSSNSAEPACRGTESAWLFQI